MAFPKERSTQLEILKVKIVLFLLEEPTEGTLSGPFISISKHDPETFLSSER